MKKRTIMAAILAMSMLLPTMASAKSADINVTFDGEKISFNAKPRIINDCVMVPVRPLFEAIGAKVQWDAEAMAATAVKDALYAKFKQNDNYLWLGACKDGKDDGEQVYATYNIMNAAATIIDGTMYVPARSVSEAFHYNIDWDADTNTAAVTTPSEADGWIYYASWTDGGHMYKSDTNGQNRQLLSLQDCYHDDGEILYDNGWIYYLVSDKENPENDGCLYRIRTDGTGAEKLADKFGYVISENETDELTDSNGDIYFVSNEISSFDYYEHEKYLYKLNTETKEVTQVIDRPLTDIRIYKDYIYFMYASDELDGFSVYRISKEGGEPEKISGDLIVSYYYIDTENDKLELSPYRSRKDYNAELDGTDIQEEVYEDTGKTPYDYGLKYIRYQGDDFIIGVKDVDENIYYVMDTDGNELSVIKIPEGYEAEGIISDGEKIFYSYRKMNDWEPEYTKYVTSIDELLGMKGISVGKEKVDGKYEITSYRPFNYEDRVADAKIHSVNPDGTEDKVILNGYYLSYINFDDKLSVYDPLSYAAYTCNKDGSGLEKIDYDYLFDDFGERKRGILNENVPYGIIVKNDGTTESYR